jgi:hypothetical protein
LELDEYITRKYQTDTEAGKVHHYETSRVVDIDGNVLLREGLQVPSTYQFRYRPDPASTATQVAYPIEVSNRAYEYALNREKSVIQILQDKYVYEYAREVQNYAFNLLPQESFVNLKSLF